MVDTVRKAITASILAIACVLQKGAQTLRWQDVASAWSLWGTRDPNLHGQTEEDTKGRTDRSGTTLTAQLVCPTRGRQAAVTNADANYRTTLSFLDEH
jgi:hypothetical protein